MRSEENVQQFIILFSYKKEKVDTCNIMIEKFSKHGYANIINKYLIVKEIFSKCILAMTLFFYFIFIKILDKIISFFNCVF